MVFCAAGGRALNFVPIAPVGASSFSIAPALCGMSLLMSRPSIATTTVGLLLWLGRSLAGEQLRSVYLLYELYFIIVLPGTFALMRGRDDRTAAGIFCIICIFTALAATLPFPCTATAVEQDACALVHPARGV